MIAFKKGDTLPILEDTLKAAGVVLPLAGCTVRFLAEDDLGNVRIDAPATIVDASAGTVEYTWAAGDTNRQERLFCWWKITTAGGEKITVPNQGAIEILFE